MSDEQPASARDPCEVLAKEIRETFEELEDARVLEAGDGTFLALVRVGGLRQQADLGRRIALDCAVRGQLVMPAIVTTHAWEQLMAAPALAAGSTGCSRLVAQYAAAPPHEAAELLRRVYRSAEDTLAQLGAGGRLPVSALFTAAANVVGSLLSHWLAFRGVAFDGGRVALAGLSESGALRRGDLALYLALQGAALGETLLFEAQVSTEPEQPPWAEIDDLMGRFDHWLRDDLPTPTERRRRRRGAMATAAGLLAAASVIFLGFYLWSRPPAPVNAPVVARRGGIRGRFYSDRDQQHFLFERATPGIDLNSPEGAFLPGLPAENFSVRWEGLIEFTEPGQYALCVDRDDGARIHFRGRLLLDGWVPTDDRLVCTKLRVRRGWYPLRVDFVQHTGPAFVRVLVAPDGGHPPVPVPAERWCCTGSEDGRE